MEGNCHSNALRPCTGVFGGFITGGLIRSIRLATAHRHASEVSLLGSSENTPTLPPPGHQGQLTHAGLRGSLSPKTISSFSG